MNCAIHNNQLKTHLCLKPQCFHSLLCQTCITESHTDHMAVELDQIKDAISCYLDQESDCLPRFNLIELSSVITKIQKLFQELLSLKNQEVDKHLFEEAKDILNRSSDRQNIAQVCTLKRVCKQLMFYKNPVNQWQIQLVKDNSMNNPNFSKLKDSIKKFVIHAQQKVQTAFDELKDLEKIMDKELTNVWQFKTQRKSKKSKYYIQEPELLNNKLNKKHNDQIGENEEEQLKQLEQQQQQEQQQQEQQYKQHQQDRKEMKDLYIRKKYKKHKLKKSYYQHKNYQANHHQNDQIYSETPLQQEESKLDPGTIQLFEHLEDNSDSYIKYDDEPMNEKPLKLSLYEQSKIVHDSQQRIKRQYRRLNYDRFKFNTQQCLDIFKHIVKF